MAKLEIGLAEVKNIWQTRIIKGTRYQTRFSSNQERVLKTGQNKLPYYLKWWLNLSRLLKSIKYEDTTQRGTRTKGLKTEK
jgi:hypothetical protein